MHYEMQLKMHNFSYKPMVDLNTTYISSGMSRVVGWKCPVVGIFRGRFCHVSPLLFTALLDSKIHCGTIYILQSNKPHKGSLLTHLG